MDFDESTTSTNQLVLLVILPEGGEERYPLQEKETTIGRDPANHVCISNHFVSSFHARIIRSGDRFSVVDLGSANKTRVNGRPVVQKAVKPGDEIHFAGVCCRLVEPTGASSEVAEPDVLSSRPIGELQSGVGCPKSSPAEWRPPVSKFYLLGGVLVLFAIVAALTTQVC